MQNEYKKIIENHLKKMAENDPIFAGKMADNNKSIDKCFEYILNEARKLGRAVCVRDEVVFGWAVHYYDEPAEAESEQDETNDQSSEPIEKPIEKPIKKLTHKKAQSVQLSLFDLIEE